MVFMGKYHIGVVPNLKRWGARGELYLVLGSKMGPRSYRGEVPKISRDITFSNLTRAYGGGQDQEKGPLEWEMPCDHRKQHLFYED